MFEFGHKDIDIAPGTVSGIRGWWLVQYGFSFNLGLRGNYGYTWHHGINTAVCRNSLQDIWPHTAPHLDCRCGFYAYWGCRDETSLPVKGVVEGWGKTCIGTNGFRCQFVQIKALCVDSYIAPYGLGALRLKKNLEKQWNVPVFKSVPEMLEHHPVTRDSTYCSYPVSKSRKKSIRLWLWH